MNLRSMSVRARSARRFVRLRSFDCSTPQGRSDERYRRVILTTITQVVAKGTALLALLISVPLTVHYLGAERYGIWMTISSFVAMLSSADLGIGFGLMNTVAESYGKEDWEAAAGYVSSGFFSLLVIGAAMLGAIVLAYRHVAWHVWFNLKSPIAVHEAGPTLLVLVACVAVNIPLNVTLRLQSGLQEGYIANLWSILGQCLGLAGLVVGVFHRVGLPWLVLAVAGAPAIASLLNTCHVFFIDRPEIRPRLSLVSSEKTMRLLGMGLLFFVFQLAQMVGFQSDNLVIAHVLGASKVPVYAITTRMFSVVTLLMGFIYGPLWPAYGEALARGDIPWLRKTLVRSVQLVLAICIPVNLALVLGGKMIVKVWVGQYLTPSLLLLIGIGLSQSVMTIVTPISAFLNGINMLGHQAILAACMAVANITLSIYLTHRIGVPGVIFGSLIAETVFMLFPFVAVARKALHRISENASDQHRLLDGHCA